MDTGKRIKEIRKANGLTQKELSEKLGTSQQNLAQYENGKRQPKFETLRRIAKALDVGLDEFMSDTELSLFEGMADLYLHSSNDIKDISPCEAGSIQERYLMEADVYKRQVTRLVAPGPLVAKHTPTFPVERA